MWENRVLDLFSLKLDIKCSYNYKELLMIIRDVVLEDVLEIVDIYNFYVVNICIIFEECKVLEKEMLIRFKKVVDLDLLWFVVVIDEVVVGYVYVIKWKERSVYWFFVELIIYFVNGIEGKGVGFILYKVLFNKFKLKGINNVIGGIVLFNLVSVGLYEKMGMEKVVYFFKVGFKFDEWLDVGYW